MTVQLIQGDCLAVLPTLEAGSVHCVVTSPPYYGLRSYMPDAVRLRDDLTVEQREYVEKEVERLGLRPIMDMV
jgi:DNA modification methylase